MTRLPEQIAIGRLLFRATGVGIFITLDIRREEIATLSDEQIADLRELGATDAMFHSLRGLARDYPHASGFELDFEAKTVTVAVRSS